MGKRTRCFTGNKFRFYCNTPRETLLVLCVSWSVGRSVLMGLSVARDAELFHEATAGGYPTGVSDFIIDTMIFRKRKT